MNSLWFILGIALSSLSTQSSFQLQNDIVKLHLTAEMTDNRLFQLPEYLNSDMQRHIFNFWALKAILKILARVHLNSRGLHLHIIMSQFKSVTLRYKIWQKYCTEILE